MVMAVTDRRAASPQGSRMSAGLPPSAVDATRRLVTKPLPSDETLPLAVKSEFAADVPATSKGRYCRAGGAVVDRTGRGKVLRRGFSHGY